MITCCECGAVSQIGAVLFHNEPCCRTLYRHSATPDVAHCMRNVRANDPHEGCDGAGLCTCNCERCMAAIAGALNRTLDTQHARIKQLEIALRGALGKLRDFEKVAGVPFVEMGEWEKALVSP